MSINIVFKTAKDTAKTDLRIKGSNYKILETLKQNGRVLFVAAKNQSFNKTSNSVTVRKVQLQNGATKLGAQIDLKLNDVSGIMASSPTPKWLQKQNRSLTIINNRSTVDMRRKAEQADSLEDYVASTIVQPDKFITKDELQIMPGDNSYVVVKPEIGIAGRNVIKVEKNIDSINAVINSIRQDRITKNKPAVQMLIQPFMERQLIDGLTGLDSKNTAILKSIGQKAEIRVYVSAKANTEGFSMHAIGRHVSSWTEVKEDFWISLNQSSVPDSVFRMAEEASKFVMQRTKSNGLFIAVDIFYYKGQYYIGEINCLIPLIPDQKKFPIDSEIIIKQYLELFN